LPCRGGIINPEKFFPHRLCLDHIVPESRGGLTWLGNLALCCYGCQQQKLTFETGWDAASRAEVALFNPRRQKWRRHFAWSATGLFLEGQSAVGRAIIARLALNNECQVEARKRWKRHPDLFP
jgi:hypothetical protein